MFEFNILNDTNGKPDHLETALTGYRLLGNPKLNKGCAFTQEERDQFGLTGLLPQNIETLDEQSARMYIQFSEHHTNLSKNIYLHVLHDYNETLFYKLASKHLEEMLPILYTPTVGEAVKRFSLELRKPKGLCISYNDRNRIDEILEHRLPPEVDLSVVTDGGAVLGIGDQGIGGINISIAKLMVYSLCGGINPHRTLPIQLDVGTNNQHLLNDPMYLGWRHERITGQAYDDFIDTVVTALTKKFPHLLLHWEDIGRDHARDILMRYRNQICTLNGDMQTTGVIALASVIAGMQASGVSMRDHRVVIYGAGTAGVGIADQINDAMLRYGLSDSEARSRFYLLDKDGLLTTNSRLLDFQTRYARNTDEIKDWTLRDSNTISLYDVVKNAKPTILIGCSTASGAFNEEVISAMKEHVERPIIMPLSNPTALSEAEPKDLYQWTDGKAIIATGSPFPDVRHMGTYHRIAQSNNALAFPGIGLGVIAVKARLLSDDMLWAAANALSQCAPIIQDKTAPLLPKLAEAKMVSVQVAHAVAAQARKEGLAANTQDDINQLIQRTMWEPRYLPYRKV
jgi:malate dehydrogenase (oxaloacetate-decarboxylating)